MPKLGMTMTHGVIVDWEVSVGDRLEPGDSIASVETEKVETVLEAEVSGVISELCAETGDEIAVGAVIAYVDAD